MGLHGGDTELLVVRGETRKMNKKAGLEVRNEEVYASTKCECHETPTIVDLSPANRG